MSDETPDLFLPEGVDLQAVFNGETEITPVIEAVKKAARMHQPDLGTATSRKEIASVAYKVRRTKTYLDETGKALTEEWRKRIDGVNERRRLVREELDAAAAEIRRPLDEWEKQDKARREDINRRMAVFAEDRVHWTMKSEEIEKIIEEVRAVDTSKGFDEFERIATETRDKALIAFETTLKMVQEREAQQAELARAKREADAAKAEAEEARKRAEAAEAKAAAPRDEEPEPEVQAEPEQEAAAEVAKTADPEEELIAAIAADLAKFDGPRAMAEAIVAGKVRHLAVVVDREREAA